MKYLTGLSIGLLSVAVVITSSSPTVAERRCIPMVGCFGTDGTVETTFTTFNVYVHNKSSHPIRVTVESLRDGWRTQYWNFSPGENALILSDVKGRNIYFSAKATDGSGASWSRQQVDMGSTYTRFEYSFSS